MPHTRTTLTAIGINPLETVTGTWHHRRPLKGERFIGFAGLMVALTDHRHPAFVLDEDRPHDNPPMIDIYRQDIGGGRHWMADGSVG